MPDQEPDYTPLFTLTATINGTHVKGDLVAEDEATPVDIVKVLVHTANNIMAKEDAPEYVLVPLTIEEIALVQNHRNNKAIVAEQAEG